MPPKRKRSSSLVEDPRVEVIESMQWMFNEVRQGLTSNREKASEDYVVHSNRIRTFLEELQSKAVSSQTHSFSSVSRNDLTKMNISLSGGLILKPDATSRAIEMDAVGTDGQVWCAEMLYRHLCILQRLVPRKSEAAARLWINAFFYRVASMAPSDLKMVLNIEHRISSVTLPGQSGDTLSGYVDWLATLKPITGAQPFSLGPSPTDLKNEKGPLFISEAKHPNQDLEDHVAQVVSEMYACARTAGSVTIRGILTDGHYWMFLILMLHENGGGHYLQSPKVNIFERLNVISREAVSLISAIIAHWMMYSHEHLDVNNDYFTVSTTDSQLVIANTVMTMTAVCFPDAQSQVQEEMDKVIGTERLPSWNDWDALPQLHAFISEALRWRPVGPFGVPHRSTRNIIWRGYYIPSGTTVYGNHWSLSRDPAVFPDPEKFDPQRWLDQNGRFRSDMHYYPFGFGRRVCPGMYLANRAVFIALACLLWSFRIVELLEAPIDTTPDTDSAIAHLAPFVVKFMPRIEEARLREMMTM